MATVKSKQLKYSFKIPRSLKKSIKKNLNKIVKDIKTRERKIFEHKIHEERRRISDAHLLDTCEFLDIMDNTCVSHQMSDQLRHTLRVSFERFGYRVGAEATRNKRGLEGQKTFAKNMLQKGFTEEVNREIRAWLVEQGEDEAGVEELGEVGKDAESGLEATEEYDWTSTSTLE